MAFSALALEPMAPADEDVIGEVSKKLVYTQKLGRRAVWLGTEEGLALTSFATTLPTLRLRFRMPL